MPKDDVVDKVVGGVKDAAKAVEKTYSKGVLGVRKAVYGLTPNGYSQAERNAMEDEAVKDLPNWWGKKSKYKDQYADLIRGESRAKPIIGQSMRDQMVDDMGGQVQRVVTAKNRQNKENPAAAREKVSAAKAAAVKNSGGARPVAGPVKITAKQAATAMSGKSSTSKPAPTMRSLMGMPKPKK